MDRVAGMTVNRESMVAQCHRGRALGAQPHTAAMNGALRQPPRMGWIACNAQASRGSGTRRVPAAGAQCERTPRCALSTVSRGRLRTWLLLAAGECATRRTRVSETGDGAARSAYWWTTPQQKLVARTAAQCDYPAPIVRPPAFSRHCRRWAACSCATALRYENVARQAPRVTSMPTPGAEAAAWTVLADSPSVVNFGTRGRPPSFGCTPCLLRWQLRSSMAYKPRSRLARSSKLSAALSTLATGQRVLTTERFRRGSALAPLRAVRVRETARQASRLQALRNC
jgi:hypothetical protein